MTERIIIWAVMAVILFIVAYFYLKASKMKANDDKIYQKEIEARHYRGHPLTIALLEEYGFKIYETKDKTYAVRGRISMTKMDGYWVTEIRDPEGQLSRGAHYQIGQLIAFCDKHKMRITKQGSHE